MVQQWHAIIALNYVAKAKGIKRSMTVYDALNICPDLILIHISTFEVADKGSKQLGLEWDEEAGIHYKLFPSSICRTKMVAEDPQLPAHKRFWCEMRPKDRQKVSLKLYREESAKILEILKRFSDQVEKASCDEAYIDVSEQIALKYMNTLDNLTGKSKLKYDDKWHESHFMGHEKGHGGFVPESEKDQKLFLASELSLAIRQAIRKELGYNASCGISHNKTVAKISASENKPNGQSVVPERYFKLALSKVPIQNIRWLGGKIGKQLKDAGLETMGDI